MLYNKLGEIMSAVVVVGGGFGDEGKA